MDPRKVRRVLLLNFTALGDLLFSTPALRALRESFPHWEVDLLVNPSCQELMQEHPGLKRLWPYPGRGWRLLSLMGRLRRQGYDLAIILHGNDPEASLLARASRAPFVVGSARSPLAFAYSAGVRPTHSLEHAIQRRLNFVRLLGADTPNPHMEIFLPAAAKAEAQAVLARHFGAPPELLLALHPTGSAPYKCWPLEAYAALGDFLHREYGAALLLVSGGRDRLQAQALAAQIKAPALVTGGRFSLLTVAALLRRCRLLVGNDSGPFHLAMALKVPGLALMGADHPRRVGPYQVEWGDFLYKKAEVCPHDPCLNKECPDNRCLKAITVAEVAARLRQWWEPRFLSRPLPAPAPLGDSGPTGQGLG
jgi:ADP-heptose:LPS heptosyltransferase